MKQLHHKYFVQGVKAFELTKPLSDFPADKDWEGGVADSPSTCDSTKTKVVVLQVSTGTAQCKLLQVSFFSGASLQRCGPRRLLACSREMEFAGVDMHGFSQIR